MIIVDDASVDESNVVLDAIERAYPDIKVIRRKENGGQSFASQQGFKASCGDYIIFLDADDVLLPNFVATHIFVHLSLRVPVGISSSDMAQAAGAGLIVSTIHHFSEYVRSQKGKTCNLMRRVDDSARELWPLACPDPDIIDRVHFIPATYQDKWVWAPTSGNCFRRDALAMFVENDALAGLRSCTDAYFVRGIAVLTGSVLIDRALGIYRLHGANVFTQGPSLNGLLNYGRATASDNDQKGRRMVIDHLIANVAIFARKVHTPFHFLAALRALDAPWPRLPSRIGGCRSYVGGEVVAHFPQLSDALGRWQLTLCACLLGIAPWTLFGAWVKTLVALLASGQITMRNVDGWQSLAEKPSNQIFDLTA